MSENPLNGVVSEIRESQKRRPFDLHFRNLQMIITPVDDSIANGATATNVSPMFATESVADCWDEAAPLMLANHEETGMLSRDHFNPQLETFQKLETAGILRTMTMRLAGVLVGYAVFVISFGLTYPSLRWATSHVVYVSPSARGMTSLRFLRWQDQQLKEIGVMAIERQSSERKDLTRIYSGMGYAKVQSSWVKVL